MRVERTIGFAAADLETAAWLPDEPTAMAEALLADGRPFNGAFVPLVVHDPLLAERSFDAAEWAADLIRAEAGTFLCITPFVEKDWIPGSRLSPRQWNHAAAMIERLDELCKRYRLRSLVSDSIAGEQARDDSGLDPALPVHYVLDAGSYLPDGYIPAQLVSPGKILG